MPKKPKLAIGATPARLVAVVRATDEKAALAEVITRDRIPPLSQQQPKHCGRRKLLALAIYATCGIDSR